MTNSLRIAARTLVAAIFATSSVLLGIPRAAGAQALTGTIIIHVTADSVPLAHAAVVTGSTGTVTDQSGAATFILATGKHSFRVTPVGFRPESLTVFVGVGTSTISVPMRHTGAPLARQAPAAKAPAPQAPVQQVAASPTPAPVAAAPTPTHAPAAVGTAPAQPSAPTATNTPATNPKPVLVAVTSKRDERQPSTSPTYSEVAGRDAVEEQLDRAPGNVSELLDGFSGVRVQPLSAGSAGVGIRIRGMPARYTKVLMDGLPLLGATPEGQIPLQASALDLQRVEVIPGVTSALYGPTSLGGGVNMISAAPTSPSQVVVNGSSREASDVAVFQTQTFSPEWAATLLAGRHYANPADPDGDGWAEVDGYKRIVVRPRVYWTRSATSSWFMTGGWTTENRRSGTFADKRLPDFNRYSDDADTRRGDAGTVGHIQLDTNTLLTVRASMTREWRTRWYGDNRERDRRNEIFGDVSLTRSLGDQLLVGGVSLDRDQYAALDTRDNDYRYTTPALYGEYTWTPDPRYGATASAHLDLQSQYGDFVSPRVSVFARPSDAWLLRLSRANGVYAPTPLTDETEAVGLGAVRWQVHEAEHALGWAFDVDHLSGALDLHASLHRTVVSNPLVVRIPPGASQGMEIRNADEPARTQGADVSMQYRARALRFTANYSYVDAVRPEIGFIVGEDFVDDTTMIRPAPYNPTHSAYFDAAYEKENDRLIGVDVRFTGNQVLADSSLGTSQPYVTIDARIEKHIRRAILFVRGKNLTNVHQRQFAPVLRASSGAAGQWADNVWAPLEGLVVNAGLRLRY